MSRTPVREALSRLASEGFLSPRGTATRCRIFAQRVLNLFEVRLLLEPAAARQAAENTAADGLPAMDRAIEQEKRRMRGAR